MIGDTVIGNDWHPIATPAMLRAAPLFATRVLDQDLVVWRAGDRTRVWLDRCAHRGTRLSLGRVVDGERLRCPYHGWEYDGDGRCVSIPALPQQTPPERARARSFAVRERYGLIWVNLGERHNAIAAFPEWRDDAFRKLLCGPYAVETSGQRVVENFLDVSHFPFVHGDVLGVPTRAAIDDYQVTRDADGVVARDVSVYQPDPYGTGAGATVGYTYRISRPLCAHLLKQSQGPKFSIFLAVTPNRETACTAWMWMAMNYGHDLPERELIDWQDAIFAQDKPIVESQRPQRLPLDRDAEVHMRSDKTAAAYRRWLGDLGVRYGIDAGWPPLSGAEAPE